MVVLAEAVVVVTTAVPVELVGLVETMGLVVVEVVAEPRAELVGMLGLVSV